MRTNDLQRTRLNMANIDALRLAGVFSLTLALLTGCSTIDTPSSSYSAQAVEGTVSAELPFTKEDKKRYYSALAVLHDTPSEAQTTLRDLSERYPHSSAIWTNLAVACVFLEDYANAAKTADRALALDATIAAAYNVRGLVAVETHNFAQAEKDFLHALEMDKAYALPHYNLALLYDIYLQDIASAIEHYERYLEAYPKDDGTRAWVEQLRFSLEKS